MKQVKIGLFVTMLLIQLSILNCAFAEEVQSTATEGFAPSPIKLNLWEFVALCGAISIMVKIVDYVMQWNETGYESKPIKLTLAQWMLWFISASIVGFLGYIVALFQSSAQAAVMVGLGWPKLYVQLKETYASKPKNHEGQPIQLEDGVFADLSLGEEQITSNECYDVNENEGR